MNHAEAIALAKEVGKLPKSPIVQNAENTRCPCGTKVLLVCAEGIEFHPAYYVCPSCKRTVKIGGAH